VRFKTIYRDEIYLGKPTQSV